MNGSGGAGPIGRVSHSAVGRGSVNSSVGLEHAVSSIQQAQNRRWGIQKKEEKKALAICMSIQIKILLCMTGEYQVGLAVLLRKGTNRNSQ